MQLYDCSFFYSQMSCLCHVTEKPQSVDLSFEKLVRLLSISVVVRFLQKIFNSILADGLIQSDFHLSRLYIWAGKG